MRDRPEGGLIDYELQKKSNEKISTRAPLINEYVLDVTGLDISRVVEEAVHIIESSVPLTEYEYVKPEKDLFYSWVFSNGLR